MPGLSWGLTGWEQGRCQIEDLASPECFSNPGGDDYYNSLKVAVQVVAGWGEAPLHQANFQ
jgi:hypothetical protein